MDALATRLLRPTVVVVMYCVSETITTIAIPKLERHIPKKLSNGKLVCLSI